MSEKYWWKKLIDFNRREREERREILKDHNEKWAQKRIELFNECEADGGHEFQPLPNNGFNRADWSGKWPEACKKCGMRK